MIVFKYFQSRSDRNIICPVPSLIVKYLKYFKTDWKSWYCRKYYLKSSVKNLHYSITVQHKKRNRLYLPATWTRRLLYSFRIYRWYLKKLKCITEVWYRRKKFPDDLNIDTGEPHSDVFAALRVYLMIQKSFFLFVYKNYKD